MEQLFAQIGLPLIAVIVPIIVWGAKEAVQHLPKWTLPILAGALGPAIDQAVVLAAGFEASHGWLALVAGFGGVGLRELKDQLQKAIA